MGSPSSPRASRGFRPLRSPRAGRPGLSQLTALATAPSIAIVGISAAVVASIPRGWPRRRPKRTMTASPLRPRRRGRKEVLAFDDERRPAVETGLMACRRVKLEPIPGRAGLAGEPDRLPGGLECVRGRRARDENGLIQHYYYFLAKDSEGQEVLDGQVINLALTAITGGAKITAGRFGSNDQRRGCLSSPESQRTTSRASEAPRPDGRVWNKGSWSRR